MSERRNSGGLRRRDRWWAESGTQARRGLVGAVAVVAALSLVSYYVWTSPGSPVAATADAIVEELTGTDPEVRRLQEENAALLASIEGLREEVSTRDAMLKAKYSGTAPLMTTGSSTIVVNRPSSTQATGGASGTGSTGTGGTGSSSGSGGSSSGSGSGGTGGGGSNPTPAPPPTVTPTPTGPTAPSLAALAAPQSRLFGLYTQQAPFNWATFDAASSSLETTPSVVGYFGGFDEAFRPNAVTRAWQREMMPILTWESRPISSANNVVDEPEYSLPRIIDGEFDEYLRTYARDIVATGLPMGIRLNHEMNGTWYPWSEQTSSGASINGNSPGDFVAMWQHVHDIFEEEGANDLVLWIWSPNRVNNLPARHQTPEFLSALYPGDEYVDWVGLSGYLRPPYRDADLFTFDDTFDRSLDQLRVVAPGKPILLAEVGASETGVAGRNPTPKAGWVRSMWQSLQKPENDDIVGLVWFNLAVTTWTEGAYGTNDWRVESRPSTLEAFRLGVNDPAIGFGPLPAP